MNNQGSTSPATRGRDSFYQDGRELPPASPRGLTYETEQIRQRLVGLNGRLETIVRNLRMTPPTTKEVKEPGSPDIATAILQIHCQLNRADGIVSDIERQVFGGDGDGDVQRVT